MKEFIEKLIGRFRDCTTIEDYGELFVSLDEVENIINELAEEYEREVDQTDYANIELYNFWLKHQWIPCSERLPDKEGTYLVTLKKWETITFARFTDIKTNPHFNALVIAWMPLPQPYTEEQKELSTTWQQQTMNRFERVD